MKDRERHPITDTPFGSPEASEVRVLSVNAEDGTISVRFEDPWESDLAPGTTLGDGPRLRPTEEEVTD